MFWYEVPEKRDRKSCWQFIEFRSRDAVAELVSRLDPDGVVNSSRQNHRLRSDADEARILGTCWTGQNPEKMIFFYYDI